MNNAGKFRWCGVIACTALVSACGGADDLSDKYEGTWVSGCDASGLYSSSNPQDELKAVYRYTFVRTHGDTLKFLVVQDVFPSSGCSGAPLATHVNASSRNTYVIDGTKVLNGVEVDKITINMGALGGASSTAGPFVRNGISYPGDFFVSRVDNEKDVVAIHGRGMRFGTGERIDEQGYPTVLEATRSLTKS